MGGKNSFANQVFNPGNIWGWNKPKPAPTPAPKPKPAPTPMAAPAVPSEKAAADVAMEYENKKRKAAGRESTVLTSGLGGGMNTTYSVNKPTLGA